MPIECKASNSEVNSYKRLNHEAEDKGAKWARTLEAVNPVPAAVISGVFKVENLHEAQASGLTLFWEHELDTSFRDFIRRAA